jgi:hypothetical protein
MKGISIALQVIFVTSIIGLAISYFTKIIDIIPDLNFFEAVGIYALYMPLHHTISSSLNKSDEPI